METLLKFNGQRIKVTATVEKLDSIIGYTGFPVQTVSLIDVIDQNENYLLSQVWMFVNKKIAELNLKMGDRISFVGRVATYRVEGENRKQKVRFKFANPNQLEKIEIKMPHTA